MTGKLRTVWAFVMVLACSRHMFVRPVLKMDQRAWTECHVEAFGFFGGVPARLVPDTLKTGVDKPDLYDPKVNRSYAELATLDARLAQAHAGELGHLDFLQVLCQDEVSRRESMSLARRIRRARFESDATLEGFDFTAAPKLPAAQIRDLAALAGGRADRTWDKRLAELTRPAVLVLGDFAMRELTAPQADDLYELITGRAGKSLILTSNRAPADWYPSFPNPVVA